VDNALVIAFLCLTAVLMIYVPAFVLLSIVCWRSARCLETSTTLAGLAAFGTWFARLKWGPGYYGRAIADDAALGLLGAAAACALVTYSIGSWMRRPRTGEPATPPSATDERRVERPPP
jgi:hypothetical protein